jgi:hypothetical protein
MAAAAVVSLVLLVLSVLAMARRVDDYYRETDHRLYVFNRVEERQFSYAGRPVTITDERTPAGDESVAVRYGDASLSLKPTIEPGSAQMPGLERHNDWMQALRFVEHGRTSLADVEKGVRLGEIADHLVVVVRTPPPGADQPAPNEAYRKAWLFDFYEFKPEGGFEHQRLGFPKKRTPAEGEMAEGTWQYYAALMVMPPLWKPTQKFTGDALQATGWTLPVAALSGLLFTVSGVALLAPRKRTPAPAPAH